MPSPAHTSTAGPAPAAAQVDQDRLRSALNRYLASRTLAAPDPERSAARAALVQLLTEAGWEPPEAVRRALERDTLPGAPAP